MTIAWEEKLKVGNLEIDADHKELIGMINEFEAKTKSPDGVSLRALQITLERLQLYVHDHFAREEYIQAIAKYPGLSENKRQHDALRKTLADFIARFESGALDEPGKAADEMATFLNHWLMNHILEVDIKMRGALVEESWR